MLKSPVSKSRNAKRVFCPVVLSKRLFVQSVLDIISFFPIFYVKAKGGHMIKIAICDDEKT